MSNRYFKSIDHKCTEPDENPCLHWFYNDGLASQRDRAFVEKGKGIAVVADENHGNPND